jgi:F-type H+-transporting ATPase subunit b
MPQFDPTWFASQVFWLVIVFAGLFWFMTKQAIPRVEAALDKRAERIQGDLDRAAKLHQDAAAAAESHQSAIVTAREEAREILREAQAKTQADLDQRQAALTSEIAKQTLAAEGRISAARDAAMASVREIAVEAAQAVSERLTHASVGTNKAASAVDAVLDRRSH